MKPGIKFFLMNAIRALSGKKLIVSLTSYPPRFEKLHYVIESMLHQTLPVSQVVLYIFEGDADQLPESVTRLQSKRFAVVPVKDDIRPHKKYYYAFKDHPKDLIITVDDDYVYPRDLVWKLYRKHLRYRHAIIGGRCRRIEFTEDGELLPYAEWGLHYNDGMPGMSLLATGVGGVLYSPRLLDERVLDMEALKELALDQDDLWLKVMEVLKGTKTVAVSMNWKNGRNLHYDESLFSSNESGANDACVRRLLDHFAIRNEALKE